jgi:CBS domain-containing protein
MKMQLKDIIVDPPTIDKSEKLSYALDKMEKLETRRLLVMHNGNVNGIVTMRSITRELGTRNKSTLPASAMHVTTATTDNFSRVRPDMPVNEGIILMNKNEGVLLVMNNDEVIGWITPHEIIKNYPFNNSLAGEIMRQPITIGPDERVIHARRILLDNNIGRLPVMENGALVGIITEHDIAVSLRALKAQVSNSKQDNRIKNLLVEDIMSRGVITVNTDTPVQDVVSLMLEKNLGGVPVVNNKDELVGLITRRLLLKAIAQKI